MNTVGIIAEYNPFHNGHAYQLAEAKRITGADHAVVVMSGNFVQRGTPAVFNKYLRTRTALLAGADAVFELPVSFASSSAELFAEGSIALLQALGVDSVCFGSECGDIDILNHLADLLSSETEVFKTTLNKALRTGKSFPAAREEACLSQLLADGNTIFTEELPTLLQSPNNLLGIEYCRAIKRLHSPIKAFTLQRIGSAYHSTDLPSDNNKAKISPAYTSATAIRALFENPALSLDKKLSQLEILVPESVYSIYNEELSAGKATCPGITPNDFSILLSYCLLYEKPEHLSLYQDWNSEFVNRLLSEDYLNLRFDELALRLKSKQITLTRAYRMLLHALLQIPSETILRAREQGSVFYARLLGFRKSSSACVKEMQNNAPVPVINRLAPVAKVLTGVGGELLMQDIRAAELYRSVQQRKEGRLYPNEYQAGVITLP